MSVGLIASANATAGSVSYSYAISGQLTGITGPGFTQRLYYNDGVGTPRYNGSLSSYIWTMGMDSRKHGYKFSYDNLNRLTRAAYGVNEDISSYPDHYTEEILEFGPNSMPRRLQRHGLKADGEYGKIDNLHISFTGNRITGVIEDARAVTTPGSMDFAGKTNQTSRLAYDAAGNLISDTSRGIGNIAYDYGNRPVFIDFGGGNTTAYVYSATGEKLRTVHTTAIDGVVASAADGQAPMQTLGAVADTTDYRGEVEYRSGRPSRYSFAGGYVSIETDGTPKFHYFTADHLGSVRATVSETGAIEQTVAYYAMGGVIADLGRNRDFQQHKYIGKELDLTHGLAEYDHGARRYRPALLGFSQPDAMAESYPWLNPYLYCAANPVNALDPDGNDWIFAQYEKDTFYFWMDGIKSQEDIENKFPNNEGIRYVGKKMEFYASTKSGVAVFMLNDDGTFEINEEQQDNEYDVGNVHVGSDKFTKYEPKKGIKSFWYGVYVGPYNPKQENGTDSYCVPPISYLDYAAFRHDKDYDKAKVAGPLGTLYPQVSEADAHLAYRAQKYLHSDSTTIKGRIWAYGVWSLIFNLSNFKSGFKTF